MARLRGSVKWFDPEKGWGFIRLEDGDEVFVHHSDIQGSGFRSLKDGAEVELEVERADRGPRARNVVPIGGRATEPDGSSRETRSTSETGERQRGAGRSRTRRADREQPGRKADPQSRHSTGALPERQTLDEQIRRRLADRFTFPS
jgi:CspA family cold shock protein